MSLQDEFEYQLDTLAIRTGHTRSFEGEHGEPIFLTSSFVYENAERPQQNFQVKSQGTSTRVLPIQLLQCLKNALQL